MALNLNEDVLYNLAHECESQFDKILQQVHKTYPEKSLVVICTDYQQSFDIWAANLGVFAEKDQCSDARLRNFPYLQDVAAKRLDSLRLALLQLLVETSKQAGEERHITRDNKDPSQDSQIETTLESIRIIIAHLDHLGVMICLPNSGKMDMRARESAADQSIESFASLSANVVQALYPGASQLLKAYLSESMAYTYSRITFSISRNTSTSSELPSVDIQQTESQHGGPNETLSAQDKHGSPQPPWKYNNSKYFTCKWCGEQLNKGELSETDWRQHLDRDFRPYICLFERCSDAHPAYPTFNEWYKHMESHDQQWYKKIYLKPSCVCPICGPSHDNYADSNALYSHLTESHSYIPSAELRAISQQSKVTRPRVWNDCLLCCSTIKERKGEHGSTASDRESRQEEDDFFERSRRYDLSDEFSSLYNPNSRRQGKEERDRSGAVARHAASHLQVLMLLTLRVAALRIDGDDVNDDIKSNAATIEGISVTSEDTNLEKLYAHFAEDLIAQSMGNENDTETSTSPDVDVAKDDASVSIPGVNFGLALRQYEDPGAHNGLDSMNVIQWLDQLEQEEPNEEVYSAGVKKADGCIWIIRQQYTECGCIVTESERRSSCKGPKMEDHTCGIIDQGIETLMEYCGRAACPNPGPSRSEEEQDKNSSHTKRRSPGR